MHGVHFFVTVSFIAAIACVQRYGSSSIEIINNTRGGIEFKDWERS